MVSCGERAGSLIYYTIFPCASVPPFHDLPLVFKRAAMRFVWLSCASRWEVPISQIEEHSTRMSSSSSFKKKYISFLFLDKERIIIELRPSMGCLDTFRNWGSANNVALLLACVRERADGCVCSPVLCYAVFLFVFHMDDAEERISLYTTCACLPARCPWPVASPVPP